MEFMLVEVSMMNMILGLVASVTFGATSRSSVSSAITGAPAINASKNPAHVPMIFGLFTFMFMFMFGPLQCLLPYDGQSFTITAVTLSDSR